MPELTKDKVKRGLSPKLGRKIAAYTGRWTTNHNEEEDGNDAIMEFFFREYATSDFIAKVIDKKKELGMSGMIFDAQSFKDKIDKFREPNHKNFFWNKNYQTGLEKVRRDLTAYTDNNGNLSRVEIETVEDVLQQLTVLNTSPGYLGWIEGVSKKKECIEAALMSKERKMRCLQNAEYSPIIFATRTKCVNTVLDDGVTPNPDWSCSTRVIHVISFEDILIEMELGKPVMDMFKGLGWYAGGYNDEQLTQELLNMRRSTSFWLSIDYSSYDMSISDWLIRDAFGVLWELFPPGEFSEDYKTYIVEGFTKTHFVDVDGKIRRKNKGVPSGSYFTQIIDTIVNRVMIETFMASVEYKFGRYYMVIMGDDNIIFTDKEIDRKALQNYLNHAFGITCNKDKMDYGTCRDSHPSFLHRQWTPKGPIRNVAEIVIQYTTPERYRRYVKKELKGKARLQSKLIRPEEVFYSAVLSYPITMKQWFDIDRFMSDFPHLSKIKYWTEDMLAGASGSLKYRILYGAPSKWRIRTEILNDREKRTRAG